MAPVAEREAASRSWGAKPFPGDRAGAPRGAAKRFEARRRAAGSAPEARVAWRHAEAGETAEYALGNGRHGYLVPAEGEVEVNA